MLCFGVMYIFCASTRTHMHSTRTQVTLHQRIRLLKINHLFPSPHCALKVYSPRALSFLNRVFPSTQHVTYMNITCTVVIFKEEGDTHLTWHSVHHDMPCDPNVVSFAIPLNCNLLVYKDNLQLSGMYSKCNKNHMTCSSFNNPQNVSKTMFPHQPAWKNM